MWLSPTSVFYNSKDENCSSSRVGHRPTETLSELLCEHQMSPKTFYVKDVSWMKHKQIWKMCLSMCFKKCVCLCVYVVSIRTTLVSVFWISVNGSSDVSPLRKTAAPAVSLHQTGHLNASFSETFESSLRCFKSLSGKITRHTLFIVFYELQNSHCRLTLSLSIYIYEYMYVRQLYRSLGHM